MGQPLKARLTSTNSRDFWKEAVSAKTRLTDWLELGDAERLECCRPRAIPCQLLGQN